MAHNDNTPSKEQEQKSPWYLNFWILSIITLSLWGMTWLTLWLVFTGVAGLHTRQAAFHCL